MRSWLFMSTLALCGVGMSGCSVGGATNRQTHPTVAVAGDSVASAARGSALVQSKCAGCHAVGRTGDSPLAAAPPFRGMGVRYPVADLQEAFAEGLVTTHPSMPPFVLQPGEIRDLIAYLESVSAPPEGSAKP